MPGLYLHVPFCARKCAYCSFYSLPAGADTRARYVRFLCRLLAAVPGGRRRFTTVYFGGGTPPLLGAAGVTRILEAAASCHEIAPDAEITLECNPETTGPDFLRDVRKSGVNRLSIGLQSSHADQLRFLGRAHTAADAARCVANARRAGIDNLSLDIMLALPGQTPDRLRGTIDFCARLAVPHLSAYLLGIEPGTRFDADSVRALCPGEDEQANLYLTAVEEFESRGLRQYEISNFARPGFESRHNTGYWKLDEYVGLGPAAHSFTQGRRRFFDPDLEGLLDAADPWANWRDDGPGGGLEETLMLRLRLREGFDPEEAKRRFGCGAQAFRARAKPLVRAGYMRDEAGTLSLTPRGFLVSNTIIAELLGNPQAW